MEKDEALQKCSQIPQISFRDWKGYVPNDLLRMHFAPSMKEDKEVTCIYVG